MVNYNRPDRGYEEWSTPRPRFEVWMEYNEEYEVFVIKVSDSTDNDFTEILEYAHSLADAHTLLQKYKDYYCG